MSGMVDSIIVVEWAPYDVERPENDLGGLGGWVQGENFEAYLQDVSSHMHAHARALRDAIVQAGIRSTGNDHQNQPDGAPVFSDGTVSRFSCRAWGDLMAAIWNTAENTNRYGYLDFYW